MDDGANLMRREKGVQHIPIRSVAADAGQRPSGKIGQPVDDIGAAVAEIVEQDRLMAGADDR